MYLHLVCSHQRVSYGDAVFVKLEKLLLFVKSVCKLLRSEQTT